MESLKSLNEKQREAVQQTEGPLLVIAGAGSGKTRVLTHRIAYLIREKQVSPFNIIAVTFTNKAAEEMKNRLKRLIGIAVKQMWIGTFHAICGRILREEIEALGFNKNYSIYDEDDQFKIVSAICNELELSEKAFNPRAVLNKISSLKNELIWPDQFERQAFGYFEEKVAIIYRRYQDKLFKLSALDFDDLLMFTVELFQKNPAILEKYQERFVYISVDEYQDTNHSQYMLTKILARKYQNICVIGDADQSIYAWRGANFQNILNFEHDYPDAKVIKLEQNYRSTKNIVAAANSVIENNVARKDKTLWTNNDAGEKLYYYEADNEEQEARFIAEEIKKLSTGEGAHALSEIAILYRTNAQSRMLEEVLLQKGIPYQIVSGVRFYERKEVKDVLSALRVIFNPQDDLSAVRFLASFGVGVGKTSIQMLEDEARKKKLSILGAVKNLETLNINPKSKRGIAQIMGLVGDLAQKLQELPAVLIIEEILSKTEYQKELEAEGTDEALGRVENIKELITVAKKFEEMTGDTSLEGFLTQMALVSQSDMDDKNIPRVTMMTLHSAKGLEFPVVFLVGLEEGVFPHYRSLDDTKELEEERRLCYVGLTRAQQRLYLVSAKERLIFGETWVNPPSRFLEEIPQKLLDRHAPVKTLSSGVGIFQNGELQLPDFNVKNTGKMNLAPGDMVQHEKWGRGRVNEVNGDDEEAILVVSFDGIGTKTLMMKYAPIVKV